MKTIAIVGDIHGHLKPLQALYEKVNNLYSIDQWYSCGDVCDRGPNSKGVIQFLIDHKFNTVLGNHDEWLLHAIRYPDDIQMFYNWVQKNNGGEETIKSYGGRVVWKMGLPVVIDFSLPRQHEEWLYNLPTVIETEHCFICHGGISPSNVKATAEKLSKKESDVIPRECNGSSIRWFFYGSQTAQNSYNFWDFGKPQVVGHNFVQKPYIGKHHIAIDTGCGLFKDAYLTALILPSKELVQVKVSECY